MFQAAGFCSQHPPLSSAARAMGERWCLPMLKTTRAITRCLHSGLPELGCKTMCWHHTAVANKRWQRGETIRLGFGWKPSATPVTGDGRVTITASWLVSKTGTAKATSAWALVEHQPVALERGICLANSISGNRGGKPGTAASSIPHLLSGLHQSGTSPLPPEQA